MFNLLLQKCMNHNMEKMTHFIDGVKIQTRMLFNTSVGGTLRAKTDEELKTLIENMCQNEYHSSEQAVEQKGILAVDSNTTFLAHMEVLSKQLDVTQLAQANVSQA